MENRRPGRRPGSSRPSSRFNPITGEDYHEQNVNDANENSSNNTFHGNKVGRNTGDAFSSVPALELGQLGDPERYVPVSSHQDPDIYPATPTSAVSWGPSSTRLQDADMGSYEAHQTRTEGKSEELLETQWIDTPYKSLQRDKIANAVQSEEQKRNQRLENEILIDQLSRAVISDPSQSSGTSRDADDLYHQPGQPRGAIRHLHQSKIRTTEAATELRLSERVRFGARILTRNPADSVRELTGFFFSSENSLTIYEYKQIGKQAKALPLISRGIYVHKSGPRKGMTYSLSDIYTGNVLTFEVKGQSALPLTTRSRPVMFVKINQVDNQAKRDILFSGLLPSEQSAAWHKLHEELPAEKQAKKILHGIQDKIQLAIKKRSVKTITGLSSHLSKCDRNGDGVLDKYELKSALKSYHIEIDDDEFDHVWDVVDENKDGAVDFGEFLRSFCGSMSELRKIYVRKAFQKMDPLHQGLVNIEILKKFFNAARHPWVKTGQSSEVSITEQFLASWQHCANCGQITYPEFEDYYEGLSIAVDDDNEFVNILRNCWGI